MMMVSEARLDKDSFPILVCSANLGNARPDTASIHAWIPEDGRCDSLLSQESKYPLPPDFSITNLGPYAHSHERFVLIAIGMQEATWDAPAAGAAAPESRSSLHSQGVNSVTDGVDGNEPPTSSHSLDARQPERDEDAMHELPQEEPPPATLVPSPQLRSAPTVLSRRRSVTRRVTKPLQKAVRSVRGLTASRDHTRSRQWGSDPGAGAAVASTSAASPRTNTNAAAAVVPGAKLLESWDFGTQALHRLLEARLPSYRRLVSFQRGEMRLEIFVLQRCVDDASVAVLHVAAQNTGRAGLANKGGIVAELSLRQTRLAFVTCHLEAHEGRSKYEIRCNSMADIFQGTKPNKLHDVSLSSHYAFVLGDLNFRTELDAHEYTTEEEHKQKVRDMVQRKDWESLNRVDELHRALRNKDCLVGFRTLPCHFPPTFKVGRQVGYDYVDKRRPSYTDRILWKGPAVKPLVYEPIDDFTSSDHKPVRAAFAVPTHSRLRMRPRMSRYGTLERSLRRSPIKSNRSTATVAHKNKLFLFVSQVCCRIDRPTDGSAAPPSPYVLLVSHPEAAVQQKVRLWDKLRSLARIGHTTTIQNPDGSQLRLAFGWPRSSLKRGTYEPEWMQDDEELQCQIQTHGSDGSPIDLTGCMLRITLMKDTKSDDPVIGTVQYNLAGLLKKCIGPDGMSSAHDLSNRQISSRSGMAKQSSEPLLASGKAPSEPSVPPGGLDPPPPPPPPGDGGTGPSEDDAPAKPSSVRFEGEAAARVSRRRSQMQGSATARRSSVLNLFRNANEPRSTNLGHDDDDDDPIVFDVVDEPLLKNGRQVGTMQCKIEAWWMTPFTSRAVGRAGVGRDGSSGTKADEDVGLRTIDPTSLLSPRHNDLLAPAPSSPLLRRLKRASGGPEAPDGLVRVQAM